MGGALRCCSGLQMYCSCPYGPGGELDRSAKSTIEHLDRVSTYLFINGHNIKVTDLTCPSIPESRPAARQTPQSLTSSPGSGC